MDKGWSRRNSGAEWRRLSRGNVSGVQYGIGMAIIVAERDANRAKSLLKAIPIGGIEPRAGKTRLVF
jgi:hypothetical protein